MALTAEQRKLLKVALGGKEPANSVADQIADLIGQGANPVAAAVADIADPSTADAEEVANKVNELLAAMRAAGMLAE